MRPEKNTKIKSPLRWAGGKTWLTKTIDNYLPKSFNDYYEPFLGGAAITLYLANKGLLKKEVFLSDCNSKLIEFYLVVKDNPVELMESLLRFENSKEFYYVERQKIYDNLIDRAAQFFFLNKTSFNGIYRENLKGVYNVPYGNKSYKQLFDFKLIEEVSNLLQNVSFETQSFIKVRDLIKKDDFIFLDPPYTVAHENNGFVKYNQNIFSWNDQIELKKLVEHVIDCGAYFILTNAYHESILDLYKDIGKQHVLERPSVVGGKNAKRTNYKELLITNVK